MAAIDYLASENPSPFQVNFSMFPNTIPPFRFSNNAFLTNCPNPQLSPFQYFASQSSCLSNNATSDDAEEHQYHTIIDERKHLDELRSEVVRLRAENSCLMEVLNHLSEFHDKVVQENVRLEEELSELKEIFISMSFSPQENKLKAVKENKLDDKASVKENKDDCKASVKVYTRRVGQEVFWDKKLERHRTSKELEMDPGSLTAQSASSLHWPISLPDGGRVISLLQKKIMRKTFKRKCSAIGVSFEDHEQHFSSRCDYAANSLGVKPICEQHGFNLVSTVKRIRRQYVIHQCTFRQGYSFVGERPAGVLSLSMEEKLVSRLQFLHMSWLARSSRHPLASRGGSEIFGHIVFSSNEFPTTNNGAPPGRQGQCGSSASRPEKERMRETTNREETASHTINREVLEQHFGKKREDVAKILGISVSTLKRICKKHGISKWPYWRRNKGNSFPSSQRVPPWPDWGSNHGCPNNPILESLQKLMHLHRKGTGVMITTFVPNLPDQSLHTPDPNGEKNPSPTVNMLSPNGQIRREKEMGGPNSEPNEYLPASFEDPNFQNTGNGSIAEFENPSSIHDSHDVHCSYADFHSSAVNNENEAAGGSGYFWGQVSELSNFTFPVHSDSAAPIQPVPTIPHTMAHPHIESTQILTENMGSFEDWTNLLAPQMEPLPEGHVFGSVICTIGSVSDLAPSQPMPTIPHPMESSEYWRDMLALVEGHLMEKNHYGSFNLMEPSCSNLARIEPMPTIPHTTLPTERQDLRFVKLDATYGEDPINLYLPLMPGIMELKQAVSKQLGLGLDSFKVTYENERGKRILMTHDEDVRELLRLTSSENQDRNQLVVIKVPNITDFCGNCECDKCISLKGKKP